MGLPIVDGNYEFPCDPETLGSQLVNPVPNSHYETPTDAIGSPIINGSVPAIEDNYELPCNSDTLGSPLECASPYEVPSEATSTPDVESNSRMGTNADTLQSSPILQSSPYEVPLDSCQSKFPFGRVVQTLPSSRQTDGKGPLHKPFTTNTIATASLTDHNYEEPDLSMNHNYELPTDGIDSNYEEPDELLNQNDNYDTVADDVDDTNRPLINIYDAPCS